MDARLLRLSLSFIVWLVLIMPAQAQFASPPRWQTTNWQRGGATLDLDFVNDRYNLSGTLYSGVANFITGAGATFTRSGTTNTTSALPPFYLSSNLNQSFVSRAAVTNNVTSTFAPFYATSAQGQTFVSRASSATYFDNTGTLQTASTNTARNATYSWNGSSWAANTGTLIEPTATNGIRNNTMAGAVAADGVERITTGTFGGCSGASCTGWTTTVNGGTGSISFGSSTATLTGDGTHAGSIYQTITTIAGYTYTLTVTAGAGQPVTMQAGTSAGASNLTGAAIAVAASATGSYQFIAAGATTYIQVNNVNASAATVTSVSTQSSGNLPTNWSYSGFSGWAVHGIIMKIVGVGTSSGINYLDLQFVGTPTDSTFINIFDETGTSMPAAVGQTWTRSVYAAVVAGSTTNVKSLSLQAPAKDSGSAYLGEIGGVSLLGVGSTLGQNRVSFTAAIPFASAAYLYSYYQIGFNSGQAINMTLRLGMPQLEQNTIATSVIATSSAAVTRSADIYNQEPASYFDSSGNLNFSTSSAARTNYTYSGSWTNAGTLIEPAATNTIRNNMMVGAVVADGVERVTTKTFTGCSGASCTGWTTTINGGTGTVSFGSNTATLTGDGTHAASIYQAITTVSGYLYTIAITTGAGQAVTVQAGQTAGTTNLLGATSIAASTTISYQFTAAGTTSYVQINNANGSAATVTSVSVQSAGLLPTNWSFSSGNGVITKIVGIGTESGISYMDVQYVGTPTSLINAGFQTEGKATVAAAQNQNWTGSIYLKLSSGSWGSYNQTPQQNIVEYDSGGSLLSYGIAGFSPVPSGSGLSTQRYTATRTLVSATTAYVVQSFLLQYNTGVSVNFTLRIGAPQLEQTAYATMPIPTYGSAVTRTADVFQTPNGGAYYNSSGTLLIAAASAPRLDYGITGGSYPTGILIEGSRANLLGTANWFATASSTILSPSGDNNATLFATSTSNVNQYTYTTFTGAGSTNYTTSIYAKKASGSSYHQIRLFLDNSGFGTLNAYSMVGELNNCTVANASSGVYTSVAATAQALNNSWCRFSVTGTSVASTTPPYVAGFYIYNGSTGAFAGDGTGIYVWGHQVEVGNFLTSYIPTYGASITRAADVFNIATTATGANGAWYTAGIGTIEASGTIPYTCSGFSALYALTQASNTAQTIQAYACFGGNQGVEFRGSGNCDSSYGAYTTGTLTKIVTAFQTNNVNRAANGTAFGASASCAMPTLDTLRVGGDRLGSNYLNGWVNRIWYMPTREPDSALPDYTR